MAVENFEIRNEGEFEAKARRVVTKIVFKHFPPNLSTMFVISC